MLNDLLNNQQSTKFYYHSHLPFTLPNKGIRSSSFLGTNIDEPSNPLQFANATMGRVAKYPNCESHLNTYLPTLGWGRVRVELVVSKMTSAFLAHEDPAQAGHCRNSVVDPVLFRVEDAGCSPRHICLYSETRMLLINQFRRYREASCKDESPEHTAQPDVWVYSPLGEVYE